MSADSAQHGDILRFLHFRAETAKTPKDAQMHFLQLQLFLDAAAAADPAAGLHAQSLSRHCRSSLARLAVEDKRLLAEETDLVEKIQGEAGVGLLDVGEDWELPQMQLSSLLAAAPSGPPAFGSGRPPVTPGAVLQHHCSTWAQPPSTAAGGQQQQQQRQFYHSPALGRDEGTGMRPPAGGVTGGGPSPWQAAPKQQQSPQWGQVHPGDLRRGTAGQPPPHSQIRKREYTGHHKPGAGAPQPTPPPNGAASAAGLRWARGAEDRLPSRPRLDPHAEGPGSEAGQGDDGPSIHMFSSAKEVLVADLRKKGQSLGSLGNNPQPAPRLGLSRGGRRGGASGGYVPPFVRKGMEASNGGGGGAGGGSSGAGPKPGGFGDDEAGGLSARSLQLLAGPDGELPEAISKLDPMLVELVCNEVMHSGGLVQWDDIAGQEQAKQLVQEMVVWPMMNPHIFKGARAPPKGLLLFGPPGTGKTLIGKAIASNIQATFFNISASSLTSKWIGQGEKMVRTLFAVATALQPSVIFIDEIDSLLSARKSEGEHESSRRLKTEMLVQMEGCDPSSADRRVLLVGATNRPEELDEAARRRMPKQLYIPLPCGEARRVMVLNVLGSDRGSVASALSKSDLQKIVEKTSGYSGSDMRNLIQEACQGPVRDAICGGRLQLSSLSEADLRPVNLGDFAVAARALRRTVSDEEVLRYEAYNGAHGAKLVSQRDSQEDIMMEDNW
mmetsp:Transcript_21609/g.60057  ORF Transcript_21609/g.60057 Transcript_21609/m.60057 type:complete len:723 (+) Transcript_21609:79-2247(+)